LDRGGLGIRQVVRSCGADTLVSRGVGQGVFRCGASGSFGRGCRCLGRSANVTAPPGGSPSSPRTQLTNVALALRPTGAGEAVNRIVVMGGVLDVAILVDTNFFLAGDLLRPHHCDEQRGHGDARSRKWCHLPPFSPITRRTHRRLECGSTTADEVPPCLTLLPLLS